MGKPTRPKWARPDAERRIRQAGRLARVLRILELIQGRGRWNAATLSAELEYSARTIHRDLAVLELAGVPYSFDRARGCYQVRADFKFPVLNLTEEELLGQAVATAVTSAPGIDVAADSRPATRKLAATSGDQAKRLIEEAAQLVKVLDLKLVDHTRHQEIIRTVQWALLKRKQLSGQYKSPYQAKPRRLTLHPYRLCLVGQAWYLIAQPAKGTGPKTYRVTRFQTLRMLDRDATVPGEFDLGAYFGNAWSVFRGGELHAVEVLFSKGAATQATETKWHHTQKAERHADGSVTLRFQVEGLHEILWWLLAWTGFAKVIKPMELRQMLIRQLRAGVEMNGR